MAREGEPPRLAVHFESGDVVAALVAAVEEAAGRIEAEAARVAAAGPLFSDVAQPASLADREDRDAVVQAVAGVEEPAVGGDQDLGAEVAPGEALRQRGDRLPRR